MFENYSHPPLSLALPLGRFESAFEAVVNAGQVSTPQQLRGLVRALDLVTLGFGLNCAAREPDDIPESSLALEVVLATKRLTKVPKTMRAVLLEDLEETLATCVPMACMVHVVRAQLWKTDKVAWAQALATVLFQVEDEETCKMLTAVIAQHALKPEAGVAA